LLEPHPVSSPAALTHARSSLLRTNWSKGENLVRLTKAVNDWRNHTGDWETGIGMRAFLQRR